MFNMFNVIYLLLLSTLPVLSESVGHINYSQSDITDCVTPYCNFLNVGHATLRAIYTCVQASPRTCRIYFGEVAPLRIYKCADYRKRVLIEAPTTMLNLMHTLTVSVTTESLNTCSVELVHTTRCNTTGATVGRLNIVKGSSDIVKLPVLTAITSGLVGVVLKSVDSCVQNITTSDLRGVFYGIASHTRGFSAATSAWQSLSIVTTAGLSSLVFAVYS
eukprot:Blabericola_migrator_1__3713@NODE_210_length_11383_cov_64_120272_g180_i0_p3_GENE_NODE_210_length_11383_cov_64_120272_g180_i0NODE_210_length_11383_cov_64_120272_g180_i0_p3_ORF_typecomplete_len218_score16_07DUF2574/PF10836_8/9_6DUF2574/PF10836_8/5_4e03DUF2574/PF10836_8/11_NODE_210_length_11383_cov_64_120272_g180_i042114864